MDAALVEAAIDRDWGAFARQAVRLGLGDPTRTSERIDLTIRPAGADKDYFAVLFCDNYDVQAPFLDFAHKAGSDELGRGFWPKMSGATIAEIGRDGRSVPIICSPGTLGYHLHSSHCSEQHPPSTWRLPRVASLLHGFSAGWGRPYHAGGL